ncbi:hypothetical protein HA402_004083 [Bradysia odoriphaga]|nr:hypothetical protein HA402_004083 [Bradysia odoriphaga]
MFKQLLLLALAVASVSANLNYTNCGGRSQVLAIRVNGCDQVPCRFSRGHEYYGEMDVVAAARTASLPLVIQTTLPPLIQDILGFALPPNTIFSGDACEDLISGRCPTVVGEKITVRLNIYIPNTLLATSTNVRVTLRNAENQVEVCAQLPVIIV